MQSPEHIHAELTAVSEVLESQGWYVPEGVNVHFHFSRHVAAADLGDTEEFRRRIHGADVVLLETVGWNDEIEEGCQMVADGSRLQYGRALWRVRRDGDSFGKQITRTLYKSRVVVSSVDVRDDDPYCSQVDKLFEEEAKDEKQMSDTATDEPWDLDTYVAASIQHLNSIGITQRYRELRMLTSFGPRLEAVVQAHPELAHKPNLGVVYPVGSAHTGLFRALRQVSGPTNRITRSFGEVPVFTEYNQLLRARLMGVELSEAAQRELVVRGHVNRVVRGTLPAGSRLQQLSSVRQNRIIQGITRRLSGAELEAMVRLWHKTGGREGLSEAEQAYFHGTAGYILDGINAAEAALYE